MARRRQRAGRRTRLGSAGGRSLPHRRRLCFEPLEDRRLLAGVVVGNNLDLVNGNTTSIANLIASDGGDGISLREAVLAANATAGADEITFAGPLSGQTITLGGTDLAITGALVIDARPLAANVTIDANELSRIFNITASTGDFTLAGLTLTGGKTTANSSAGFGGAIRSLTTGNLTLDQSTVTGNSTTGNFAYGGGILVKGTVTLIQSTVSGNSTSGQDARGGGVFSYGAVTLTQSTVSGNTTAGSNGYGGGIRAGGAVTLTQSTVSGNSTAGSNAKGGGIWTYNAVTLTQSTLSDNITTGYLAHGGGIWAYGAVTLTQSTVTLNHALDAAANPAMGGGVFQFNSGSNHPFTISGSIVAGNTAGGSGADLVKDPQSTLTVNYSVIGTGITPNAGGNNVVTNAAQLGPLAKNAGPTETHALLAGSPAIDMGDPSIVFNPAEFDQRGAPFVRVFDGDGAGGARIDLGAYERQAIGDLNLVVDTAADEHDGDYSAGDLSLREAIGLANAFVGADEITFAAALSGQTITLGGTDLAIEEALVIDARPLAANVTIDANEQSRIFTIMATGGTGDFTFGGLTLTGGRTTVASGSGGRGGAIRSFATGNLTLDQSTVSGNSTAGSGAPGGGIFTLFGDVMLTQSTVSGNSTTGDFAFGGGIAASGAVTLTQSTVSGNSTSGNSAEGGGIQAGGTVTLIQSSVSGNSTSGESAEGGGIRAQGSMTLTQSTVSGNSTSGNGGDGGGIFSAGTVTLTQSTVSGNNAAANAGGIWAGGSVTLTQSTVSGNSSTGPSASGGGIRTIGAVTLTQSTVTDNHALGLTAMGGGVFQANTGSNHPFSISGSIVAGNTAAGSGADLVKDQDPQSTLTVNYSLIGVTPAGGFVGIGNITGLDPLLGGLVDNGGPTLTHAPLTGSPAIDAGDPNIVFNPAEFDQRGAPFVRVFDGAGADGARIDMGAFERQTLASLNLVVDTAADENDGDYSAGNLSLREAIVLANASPDADTITFAAALSGATITLGGTELAIGEALVIDARPLASNLTIDANELSRIFHIKATTGDFTLGGLTLTGGRTTAASSAGRGGAIHSLTTGNLTMDQSTVSGNSTSGEGAEGGGIRAQGSVTLTESTVSGNSTSGEGAEGGGILAQGAVTLTQSTVSGNSTAGSLASGGGIFSFGAVTLTESTVSGNSAATIGGGIRADGAVTLTQSTVSGNNSAGSSATGGGGGIWTLGGAVTLSQSTVTDNHALGATALGGGVFQANTPLSNHPFSISGSIVAGNTAVGGGADLVKDPGSTLTINYSLIGTGITPTAGGNNVVTNNPQLGSLADNGGPTMTHELLAGSPAIDAGDPSIVFNPAEYDQRGAPFARVSGGRIDIGAFEVQPIIVPPDLLGDYNQDGSVDAADYVVWRKTLGTTGVVPFSGADGNGDGDITEADYGVWTANFGDALPPPGAGSGGVAHVDSTTGVVESTTTTTAFAEPQDVPPESLNFARSASSHMTRPGLPVANRLAPPQRSQLDLLLATSTAAKTLEDSPAAPLLNPGHPTQDDDSLALDAAFASLADAL